MQLNLLPMPITHAPQTIMYVKADRYKNSSSYLYFENCQCTGQSTMETKVQWGSVMDSLPWEEGKETQEHRRQERVIIQKACNPEIEFLIGFK